MKKMWTMMSHIMKTVKKTVPNNLSPFDKEIVTVTFFLTFLIAVYRPVL